MRAPANAPKGTAGQSYVKGKFEGLGWGANSNFEHDLGTDLWLMARDERRFDLAALVGAQVKTGPSYFKSPKFDETGTVEGWWYAESDESHFDYWCDHVAPHLLVLHDLDSQISYWVHVTREKLESTGKGRKILVPAAATVDSKHFDGLIAVATSRRPVPQWEGSAWDGASAISGEALLRYALVTPRLVAPHANKGAIDLNPYQSIALLVQMRLRHLQPPAAAAETAKGADKWEWRLFAGLYEWVTTGARIKLEEVLGEAESAHGRVAATVALAVSWLEDGQPEKSRGLLRGELDVDKASPTDHAWLLVHLSQCLQELGDLAGAREAALKVQALLGYGPPDPTASAFSAAAANTVFMLGAWDEPSLAGAIRSGDTAASWWRSQTLVSGLSRHFDDSFSSWVEDSSITVHTQDEPWLKLRSAMLLAGFSADRSGWKNSGSRLARRQLMTSSDEESIAAAFDLLRLAGEKKWIRLAVARTLRVGPVPPLVRVGSQLDLGTSTRTSLIADLAFVEGAADVLPVADCDRFVEWALGVLADQSELVERVNPTFLVESSVLDMLKSLVHAASPRMRRNVIQHLIDLHAVADQLCAQGYGRVLARIPQEEFSSEDLDRLRQRPVEDNWELTDDIEALLAQRDPAFRRMLEIRIEAGDVGSLHSYGKVTDLPTQVVSGVIGHLNLSIRSQIEDAKKGTYGMGGFDPMDALVLLNVWHPSVADWSLVEEFLALPLAHDDHIGMGIRRLGALANQIPEEVSGRLRTHLEAIAQGGVRQPLTNLFGAHTDARIEAAVALALMFPEDVQDDSIRRLLGGDPSQRLAAVEILFSRRDKSELSVLAMLANDADVEVRAASAEGFASWAVQGVGLPGSQEVLKELLEEGGTLLAVRVSSALTNDHADPAAVELLAGLLENHSSATVRAQIARARA